MPRAARSTTFKLSLGSDFSKFSCRHWTDLQWPPTKLMETLHPDRPFHNVIASKSIVRRSWTMRTGRLGIWSCKLYANLRVYLTSECILFIIIQVWLNYYCTQSLHYSVSLGLLAVCHASAAEHPQNLRSQCRLWSFERRRRRGTRSNRSFVKIKVWTHKTILEKSSVALSR